jgi:hypothetical protein
VCNYVEDELALTNMLYGATVVHVKPDVMRFEVEKAGEKWTMKVTIENGRFKVEREDD